MELGATVCTPREPRCLLCPLKGACAARARGLLHELPRLRAKPKPRPEARVALVAHVGERVLLGRRREDERFGGMWEPPSAIGADAGALASVLAAPPKDPREAGRVRHVLSHRALDVRVFVARLARAPKLASRSRARAGGEPSAQAYEALELVLPADLHARGITTLAKKVLRAAGVPIA
jgi:A/G-specific adenine glycosylase